MLAEPSKEVPLIVLAVVRVAAEVAVEALPVRAPTKVVEVTEVRPAIVVAVAPSATDVLPIVTASVVRATVADAEPVPSKILPLEYDKAPAVVADECVFSVTLFSVAFNSRLVFKSMLVKNFLDISYSPSKTSTHILYAVPKVLQ
jgi:hypothetical protein